MRTKTPTPTKTTKPATSGRSAPKRLPASASASVQSNGSRRPTVEQVEQQAYFNYLNEGCPSNRDLQNWLDAEALLAGK